MVQFQEKNNRKNIIVYAGIISAVFVQFLIFWRFWANMRPNHSVAIMNLIRILGNLGVLFSFIMVLWSLLNVFVCRKSNFLNKMILITFTLLLIISLLIIYKELFSGCSSPSHRH